MFAVALLFWYLSIASLWLIELAGIITPPDDKQKLRNLGGTFALAVLSATLRDAFKSKEQPLMRRLSALLLLFNLIAFVRADILAFNGSDDIDIGIVEQRAPTPRFWSRRSSSAFPPGAPPLPKPRTIWSFATEHVVATLLALVVHYLLSFLWISKEFFEWRVASLVPKPEAAMPTAAGARRVVMVAYANVGSGHKMAALALQDAFKRRQASNVQVVLVDLMDLCPSFFRYAFQTQFQSLTQSLVGQHTLGLLYDAADRGRAKAKAQKLFESFVSLSLVRRVAELRPECIVCTHFLPAQVLSGLREHNNRTINAQARALPIALVLTDYDLQYMWVTNVDHYFVPRDAAIQMLDAYGGLETGATASVSGIPILPAFALKAKEARDRMTERTSRQRELRALAAWEGTEVPPQSWPSADDPRPLLLYVSSGNAVSEVYRRILESRVALRVVVCTGRQADVRAELEALPVPPRHAIKMLGFVTDDGRGGGPTPGGMPTLMRCADVFVGKSGGLAVAEAAALRVPMIVLDPIPGQEQRNADVLLEAGAACKINDLPLLPRRIEDVLGHQMRKCRTMAESMAALGRPDAAFEIAETVLAKGVKPIHASRKSYAEAPSPSSAREGPRSPRSPRAEAPSARERSPPASPQSPGSPRKKKY